VGKSPVCNGSRSVYQPLNERFMYRLKREEFVIVQREKRMQVGRFLALFFVRAVCMAFMR
jgi:hypothetical protein